MNTVANRIGAVEMIAAQRAAVRALEAAGITRAAIAEQIGYADRSAVDHLMGSDAASLGGLYLVRLGALAAAHGDRSIIALMERTAGGGGGLDGDVTQEVAEGTRGLGAGYHAFDPNNPATWHPARAHFEHAEVAAQQAGAEISALILAHETERVGALGVA